jgi:magnesium-protoporphyrin O-methyltransferase
LQCADLLDPALGCFDYVVGMDSLIHYEPADAVRVLAGLAPRTARAMVFTFAPSSPALVAMRAVGRLFPRGDRAPSIVPVPEAGLHRMLKAEPQLAAWSPRRTQRIASGFYTSQALELVRL